MDVLQGAVEAAAQAGFLAVEEEEFGSAGEIGECICELIPVCLGTFPHRFTEEISFYTQETALAPYRCGKVFDQGDFDAVGGIDAINVLLVKEREGLLIFMVQKDAPGQKAVTIGA